MECKLKHASCFKCGKKGHLKEMCLSKRQREKNDFKVFKVSIFKDNISDFSYDKGKSACVVTLKDRMTVEETVTVSLWLVRLRTVLDMSIKC